MILIKVLGWHVSILETLQSVKEISLVLCGEKVYSQDIWVSKNKIYISVN